MKSLPSDFTNEPWNSILQKSEAETIARNVMVILKRTGNTWRELSDEEYEEERKKDGRYTTSELKYLAQVRPYTISPEMASKFSKDWQ